MVYFCIIAFLIIQLTRSMNNYQQVERKRVLYTDSKRSKPGYIYFIRGRHENLFKIKIGRTNNLKKRFNTHSTSNPDGIVILGIFKTKNDITAERIIRKKFAGNRISSHNEWYWLNLDLLLYIFTVRNSSLTKGVQEWLRSKWYS